MNTSKNIYSNVEGYESRWKYTFFWPCRSVIRNHQKEKHDGSLRLPPKIKHYDQSLVMFRFTWTPLKQKQLRTKTCSLSKSWTSHPASYSKYISTPIVTKLSVAPSLQSKYTYMPLLMHIFTYIHCITFNNCRNSVTTSYNIRSPRNHNPYSALSRLFCAWQTLFISHQRWVNLLGTSREIAWTGPWNQHSRHGSSWNILNFKIHGWSWWADSAFGFPSILWTYSTSPITFSDPLTFNPSVAPCCLCSTRALLGLNRLKARHWVWPRWCGGYESWHQADADITKRILSIC